jgi:hypothetical protein
MDDKMTEADYILVVHKERLQVAVESLHHVIPENSDGLIDNDEFREITKKLSEWSMAHFKLICQRTNEYPTCTYCNEEHALAIVCVDRPLAELHALTGGPDIDDGPEGGGSIKG